MKSEFPHEPRHAPAPQPNAEPSVLRTRARQPAAGAQPRRAAGRKEEGASTWEKNAPRPILKSAAGPPLPSGGEYAVPDAELGEELILLRDWARAPLNPSRHGPAVTESTWVSRWAPSVKRLAGYAKLMGREPAALADLLADGPLVFEYTLFLTEHRRALSAPGGWCVGAPPPSATGGEEMTRERGASLTVGRTRAAQEGGLLDRGGGRARPDGCRRAPLHRLRHRGGGLRARCSVAQPPGAPSPRLGLCLGGSAEQQGGGMGRGCAPG